MILRKNNSEIYKKAKALKGFVSKKTIKKYIYKNHNISKKKYRFDVKKLHFIFIIFCSSLFIYNLYTLWKKYKNNKKTEEKIQIVPLAGLY